MKRIVIVSLVACFLVVACAQFSGCSKTDDTRDYNSSRYERDNKPASFERFLPYTFLVFVAGILVLLPVASLIHAVFLRLAVAITRTPNVSFGRAFLTALITNSILLVLSLSFWMYLFNIASHSKDEFNMLLVYRFTPITYFYYLLGLILIQATIFCNALADRDSPLRFSKACFIAMVYMTISYLFTLLVIAVIVSVRMAMP